MRRAESLKPYQRRLNTVVNEDRKSSPHFGRSTIEAQQIFRAMYFCLSNWIGEKHSKIFLNEMGTNRTRLYCPQKGDKRRQIELANQNALEGLQQAALQLQPDGGLKSAALMKRLKLKAHFFVGMLRHFALSRQPYRWELCQV